MKELEEAYQEIDFDDGNSFEEKYIEYRTVSRSMVCQRRKGSHCNKENPTKP